QQRAGDGPKRQYRRQHSILAGSGVKDGDRHGRDEYSEVEAERADQEQHEQNDFQVGAFPDIANAFREASPVSDSPAAAMKFLDAKQGQRADDGGKRSRVDEEYPPRADAGNEDAGDGR